MVQHHAQCCLGSIQWFVDAFGCRVACVRAVTFDKWACNLKPPDAEKMECVGLRYMVCFWSYAWHVWPAWRIEKITPAKFSVLVHQPCTCVSLSVFTVTWSRCLLLVPVQRQTSSSTFLVSCPVYYTHARFRPRGRQQQQQQTAPWIRRPSSLGWHDGKVKC